MVIKREYLIVFSIILITLALVVFSEFMYTRSIQTRGKKIFDSLDKDFKIEDKNLLTIPKYYINLNRSKDRREKLEKQFKHYNMTNYERIEAYDKKDIVNIKKGKLRDVRYINEYSMTEFQLAITIGHIVAIRNAYNNRDKNAIIFEDDIDFSLYPLWKKTFSEIIDNMPKEVEILQLISTKKTDDINFDIEKRPSNKPGDFGCAGAYLITRKGMEKIMNNFFQKDSSIIFRKSLKLKSPCIDIGIFDFMKTYHINCNLFLMYNFLDGKNTYNGNKIQRFIERDYETLKYLTDSK